MNSLPPELHLAILSHIPPRLLRRVMVVNKYWLQLASDDALWHKALLLKTNFEAIATYHKHFGKGSKKRLMGALMRLKTSKTAPRYCITPATVNDREMTFVRSFKINSWQFYLSRCVLRRHL